MEPQDNQTPAAGAPAAAAALMKFKLRLKPSFDNGPGVGIMSRTDVFDIEAESLQQALTICLQRYVDKYGREPNQFAAFQMTLVLDTGAKTSQAA